MMRLISNLHSTMFIFISNDIGNFDVNNKFTFHYVYIYILSRGFLREVY